MDCKQAHILLKNIRMYFASIRIRSARTHDTRYGLYLCNMAS